MQCIFRAVKLNAVFLKELCK